MDPLTALPTEVVQLFDGTALESKIGQTCVLVSTDEAGWPRMALLSVGEVVAPRGSELRLMLYASSRTTAAVTATGKATILVVVDGVTFKICVRMTRLTGPGDEAAHTWWRGNIVEVKRDEVPYARVLHGIEYVLEDDAATLRRWRRQVSMMTEGMDP